VDNGVTMWRTSAAQRPEQSGRPMRWSRLKRCSNALHQPCMVKTCSNALHQPCVVNSAATAKMRSALFEGGTGYGPDSGHVEQWEMVVVYGEQRENGEVEAWRVEQGRQWSNGIEGHYAHAVSRHARQLRPSMNLQASNKYVVGARA